MRRGNKSIEKKEELLDTSYSVSTWFAVFVD